MIENEGMFDGRATAPTRCSLLYSPCWPRPAPRPRPPTPPRSPRTCSRAEGPATESRTRTHSAAARVALAEASLQGNLKKKIAEEKGLIQTQNGVSFLRAINETWYLFALPLTRIEKSKPRFWDNPTQKPRVKKIKIRAHFETHSKSHFVAS